MRNYLLYVLAVGLAFTGPACGGGGGGGGNKFEGNYLFQTRLISDGCDLRFGTTRDILYDVTQDGDSILVTNVISGGTLSGSVIGNGWIASTSGTEGPCTASTQTAYDGGSGGAVAFGISCIGTGECTTDYVATVVRE